MLHNGEGSISECASNLAKDVFSDCLTDLKTGIMMAALNYFDNIDDRIGIMEIVMSIIEDGVSGC